MPTTQDVYPSPPMTTSRHASYPLMTSPFPIPEHHSSRRATASPLPTPTERISHLLSTIASVLAAYSSLPNASPIHLSALAQCYHRAAALSPQAAEAHPLPLSPPALSRSQSSISVSFLLANPAHNPYFSGSPPGTRPDSSPPTRQASAHHLALEGNEPTAREVDALEKEWWESEIVAAWYGPRMEVSSRSRGLGGRSGRRSSVGTARSVNFGRMGGIRRRDASYVGLDDE
ncbi:hypothetical protein IAT38_006374 [Cryptococcus sp. DSM 104549]